MKKIIVLCILLLTACSNAQINITDAYTTTSTCYITCLSGYEYNGSCQYNGTHNFELDNCTVHVKEIREGRIGFT